MISSRRLAQKVRKWVRATVARRKSITFRRGSAATILDSDAGTSAAPTRKGCFAVYSNDGQHFEVPLTYLKSDIFGELLRMSEDVFGLQGAGPITLQCYADFLGSVLSRLRRRSSRTQREHCWHPWPPAPARRCWHHAHH